jgi:hypothetical protein
MLLLRRAHPAPADPVGVFRREARPVPSHLEVSSRSTPFHYPRSRNAV